MTQTAIPLWEAKRTNESRQVEELLKKAGFDQVDVYRYNSASIRVRVVDAQFAGLSLEKRNALIEPHLERLPERTQADIIDLFAAAPSELRQSPRRSESF